jgi:hypothetical protein
MPVNPKDEILLCDQQAEKPQPPLMTERRCYARMDLSWRPIHHLRGGPSQAPGSRNHCLRTTPLSSPFTVDLIYRRRRRTAVCGSRVRAPMSVNRMGIMPGFLPTAARLMRTHNVVHLYLRMAEARVLPATGLARGRRDPVIHSRVWVLGGMLVQRLAAETTFRTEVYAHMRLYGTGRPLLPRMWMPLGHRKRVDRGNGANRPPSWLVRQALRLPMAINASADEPARVDRTTGLVVLTILARCRDELSSGSSYA